MTARELARRLRLTKIDRRIVALYYADRLSVEEIARVLDISRFDVATRHRRIMAAARAQIDAQNAAEQTAAERTI
jgi:DNA-directed RNA polymerase specialized sigma subunit